MEELRSGTGEASLHTNVLVPGIPISDGLLNIWDRERVNEDGREFVEAWSGSRKEFLVWLRGIPEESNRRLPRYMEAAYMDRPDLQLAFPQVEYGDTSGLRWWMHLWGREQFSSVRLLGHSIPPPYTISGGCRIEGGVDVIGFLTAEHGIGEAARLLVESLQAAQVPMSTIDYGNTASRRGVDFQADNRGKYRTVIAAVNAELNEPMVGMFGEEFFSDTYRIGQWFWELETAPPWYRTSYKYVDELWAPTRFIAEMLKREAPETVVIKHMPLPLRQPHLTPGVTKRDLDVPDDFLFLFTFDFMSVMKRKNPIAVVQAFKKAFREGMGPVLVLKSINSDSRPKASRELREAIGSRRDIIWRDGYMDKEMVSALMNNCDCYVSLHRSEGLGLTLAEAMLLGKPVIATGYSGNMDFMSPETALCVPWRRVRVGRNADAYDRRATWAEPDVNSAAEMMKWVYMNQNDGKQMGDRAQRDLESRFSQEVTGSRMRDRLFEIEKMHEGGH